MKTTLLLLSFLLTAAAPSPMSVTCATVQVPDPLGFSPRTTDKTVCRMYDTEKQVVCYWVVELSGEHLTCLPSR